MAALAVGDRVSALDGSHDGELIDIDAGIGYVLQANGVEIEYPIGKLKPYEPPPQAEPRTLSGPLRDTVLSPAHRRLLASVPPVLLAAVAKSYDSSTNGSTSRPAFAALPESKKLDAIRIHLPSLPQRLLAPHMNLVIAMRDLARPSR